MNKYSTGGYQVHGALIKALSADTADECAELLSDVSGRFDVFREAMPHALRGEWPAVTVLVSHWHSLIGDIAESAADGLPKLVQKFNDGIGIITAGHRLNPEPIRYLDHLIGDVPFSPLIELFACCCRGARGSTLGGPQAGPISPKVSIPRASVGLSIWPYGRCSRHSSG
jgi:hypothetical protein